jgi:hypothetical protein
MSGEIRQRNTNGEMAHKCVSRCALVLLAIPFATASQRLRTVRPAATDRRTQNLQRLIQAGRSSSEYSRQRRTSRAP